MKIKPVKPPQYIWERDEKESSPAWDAFVKYRDLGPGRGQREVARLLGKSEALIARWSSRHHWVDRCAEWDAYVDRERRRVSMQAVRDMTERHARQAQAGLGALNQLLGAFLERVRQQRATAGPDGSPTALFAGVSDKDLAFLVIQSLRVLDQLTKVERTARGMPETWVMISEMNDEQLQAYVLTLLSEREAAGLGFGAVGDEAEGLATSAPDASEDTE